MFCGRVRYCQCPEMYTRISRRVEFGGYIIHTVFKNKRTPRIPIGSSMGEMYIVKYVQATCTTYMGP